MGSFDYYDYAYDYPFAEPAVEGAVGSILVFLLVFYLLMMAFAITTYVLQSLGVYTIAKRRGIHNPWLSWIPVANMWILGSISDQYQYVAKGCVRNRRKVLLGLSIATVAAVIPMYISIFAAMFSEAAGAMNSDVVLGGALVTMMLTYVVILVLAIILAVFQYIALYDLFASCDPGNAVLYLVLSILLGVVLPFFIFACRKKDLGMPPRKPAQQPIPAALEETPQIERAPEQVPEETEE